MQHPASFLYVCRGLLGLPALAGRTSAVVEGEVGSVDAGGMTGVVAFLATLHYRYRQRRWKKLARRHLQPLVSDS
jgi:hypothetical protein